MQTSLIMFVVTLATVATINQDVKNRAFVFFISALYVFLSTAYITADYFSGSGIDLSVIYHLRQGLSLQDALKYKGILTLTILCILMAIMALLFIIYKKNKLSFLRSYLSKKTTLTKITIFSGFFLAFSLHPATHDIIFIIKSELRDYQIRHQKIDTLNDSEYKEFSSNILPLNIQVSPNVKRNIVYLYAESLERSYFDEKEFPGLMPRLAQLEKNASSFTNISQAELTGWTIGGLVASQCGMPLTAYTSLTRLAEGKDLVAENNICLGDFLSSEGYRVIYMGGADLKFAGKGNFFKNHGFHEIIGREQLLQQNNSAPQSSWGISDNHLFSQSKEKLLALESTQQAYAFFMLTLDTHSPHGHMTPGCEDKQYDEGSNTLLNAVACADFLIFDFVSWFLSRPEFSATTLVVSSDHLAINNSVIARLRNTQKTGRKNLFMVFNSHLPIGMNNKPGTMLDVTPTLLALLGYQNNGLGLGRNLLRDEKTLREKYKLEKLNSLILRWKPMIGVNSPHLSSPQTRKPE